MRPLGELLDELTRRGIRIHPAGAELGIRAPRGALDATLRAELKDRKAELLAALAGAGAPRPALDFSLFFFADDEATAPGPKYRLLLECARRADRAGLAGIWTPERHFHPLGGLYPSPATLAAALAMVTTRLRLRAGSVVMPLHDPVRVAEDWAVVDHLSGGRVEVAFASGWHADDFALAPERYPERKRHLFEGMEEVRRLWRGEPVARIGGGGRPLEIRTRPRPLQPELPAWVTAVGNPETYREAGRHGAGLLTCLLSQDLGELATRLGAYRQGLDEGGHEPGTGRVVCFLHTFLGGDREAVRQAVRAPFTAYLERTLDLVANLGTGTGAELDPRAMSGADRATLLDFAFTRYFEERSLMGTPASVAPMLAKLQALGVDEVACLVDFGLPEELVLEGVDRLAALAAGPGR